jgi:hypothetical protein
MTKRLMEFLVWLDIYIHSMNQQPAD